MSTPTPDLTTFKALSFDCYGTLIDWESGLISNLRPLLSHLPPTHPYVLNPLMAVERFNHFSHELWLTQPKQLYNDNLISSFRSLAAELGVPLPAEDVVQKIGTAPGRWGPFPDTVEALLRLGAHYKLAILSNVSDENIQRTVADQLAPARIDAVYTAEKIGSYKPDLANFRYLFEHAREDLGADKDKGELLHVAVSLVHDHGPAKQLGLRSVWIARGGGEEGDYRCAGPEKKLRDEGKLGFEWRFETLGEFADEVERQFAEKAKEK